MVSCETELTCPSSTNLSAKSRSVQRQEPTCRRASTRQGDEVGFLVAIEHSRTAGYGPTNEDAIKTPFDERATDPMDGHGTEVQGVADLRV